MADNDLPYNCSLDALESLLAGVKRPGDFCVSGALALPTPMVEVAGVGLLSFPLPPVQIAALIAAAERAPYGRGEQTVLDTSVRRVWQIDPARLRIGRKSWAQSLRRVLAETARGLGCEDAAIRVELYKLLVYDPGGFFLAHRDSEKAPGMFGTLLLQLPSPHTGGELRIRHGSREAHIDLSATDCSEVGFAAFYADCEHEVRPVESGHRVCLVFNLQRGATSDTPPDSAPSYDAEVAQAARLIGAAFAAEGAPRKLVWLLAHQYSEAELGFAALKGVDAAVAGVLCRAADAAACRAHLGVVHIEESGPAEMHSMPSRGRHCRALQAFALDPRLREQRFRVRQDRREHLQRQIAQHGLDMHHVTDRTGSPQTLVCRKTRESYRRQCRQHAEDIAAMHALQAMGIAAPEPDSARLSAAVARQPQAVEG